MLFFVCGVSSQKNLLASFFLPEQEMGENLDQNHVFMGKDAKVVY